MSVALFVGCGEKPAPAKKAESQSASKGHEGSDQKPDDHAHPEHGPHEGMLIELGKEEYHAELVHDDAAGTVTIYLLDGSAKNAVPITPEEVVINLKHDGTLAIQLDRNNWSTRLDSSWATKALYFKAGVYTQDNTGYETEAGAARFDQLNTEHRALLSTAP